MTLQCFRFKFGSCHCIIEMKLQIVLIMAEFGISFENRTNSHVLAFNFVLAYEKSLLEFFCNLQLPYSFVMLTLQSSHAVSWGGKLLV